MKCLIVEDDKVSQRLMDRFLSGQFDCSIVDNGNDAIQTYIEALENNNPFVLVCLDIMMPMMNGHEVLKAIRQIEHDRGIVGHACSKIIMTSALSDGPSISNAAALDCTAYLVKPISKAKLLEVIDGFNLTTNKKNTPLLHKLFNG